MDDQDIARIVGSADTVSDKIRALAAGGMARAEIARRLGKRYQHVRNVLEGDRQSAPSQGVSEAEAPPFRHQAAYEPEVRGGGVSRMELSEDGWLKLPADLIAAWGLRAGSVLMGHLDGESFELITGQTSMKRVLEMARRLIPPGGPSMADELIADRRREVERELRGE